jgi:hypothetical protein
LTGICTYRKFGLFFRGNRFTDSLFVFVFFLLIKQWPIRNPANEAAPAAKMVSINSTCSVKQQRAWVFSKAARNLGLFTKGDANFKSFILRF